MVVHYEYNKPFAVAEKLVREIEISHWGNVQITEHYNLVHGGANLKGEFSRSVPSCQRLFTSSALKLSSLLLFSGQS